MKSRSKTIISRDYKAVKGIKSKNGIKIGPGTWRQTREKTA